MTTRRDILLAFQREKARLVSLIQAFEEKYRPQLLKTPSTKLRKLRPMSAADARRDLVAKAHLFVISEILKAKAWRSAEQLDAFLIQLREMEVTSRSAKATDILKSSMVEKIDDLLVEHAVKEKRTGKTTVSWNEAEIRRFLEWRIRLQNAGLKVLKRRKIQSDAEREIEDAERAELALLERFLYSNHLYSRTEFLFSASVIRDEGGPSLTAHNKAGYEQAWRKALVQLVDELKQGYLGFDKRARTAVP